MDERIHAALDGELPAERLTPEERSRLAAMEATLEAVVADLRAQPVPELSLRVMQALPAPRPAPAPARAPAWKRALRWLWAPQPIRLSLRPAYGFAALAALALLGGPAYRAALEPGVPVAEGRAPLVYVQFRLEAAGASRVALAGSFTSWQPRYHLTQMEPGVWSVMVPLQPGVYDYAFVVDGQEWVADPHAPQVDDSFGGVNSRISLPPLTGA